MNADPTSLPATDSAQDDARAKQPSRPVPTYDPEKIYLVYPDGRVTQQTTVQTIGQTIGQIIGQSSGQRQCPIF